MKVAGKRIPKGNLLLFLSFTAIALCFLMILAAMRADRENNVSRNNLYTGHQKNFSIRNATDEDQWAEAIPELKSRYNNFAFYVPIQDPEIIVRGIFVCGEVETPPMLAGKYFDSSTSWTDEPTVVLGKQCEKDIWEKDGKRYYTYQDINLEVIGIMGTEGESRVNHMMLMDFESAVRITGINTEYVLDTEQKSGIPEVGRGMVDLFRMPAEVSIVLPQGGESFSITRFLASDAIMDTMYVMILISFSLSTILVTLIWLNFRRQLFFAWKLCGYERRSERLEISKRFYVTAGAGFGTGLLFMSVAAGLMPDIHMAAWDVLWAFGMTIGLGTVILFFCYFVAESKRKDK
ncbi:MAG: hypothetical protein SOZ48_05270 [Eubacterium sp.]|nr:hypothetical protein [Eubacterium sp.]